MPIRVSDFYGTAVYSTEGKLLGFVDDFVFDDKLGSIVAIALASEKGEHIKTIPYDTVRACADIYIVEL